MRGLRAASGGAGHWGADGNGAGSGRWRRKGFREGARHGSLAGPDTAGEFNSREETPGQNLQARQPLRPDAARTLRPLRARDSGQAHEQAGEMAAAPARNQGPTSRCRGSGRPLGEDRMGLANQRPEVRAVDAACTSGLRARRRAKAREGGLISSAKPNRCRNRSHPRRGTLSSPMAYRGRASYEDRAARSPSWLGTNTVPLRGRISWRRSPFVGRVRQTTWERTIYW